MLNLYIIYVYIIFKCIYSFICQGGGFLRGVAFWSIKSSGLLRFILHDPGVTFLWQAEYFRQMAWKNRIYGQTRGKKNGMEKLQGHKTHWYEVVSFCLNFPFLKECRRIVSFLTLSSSKDYEVSQNCLVFDSVQFKKRRKPRRTASFLTLFSSKIEGVSQNCFVLDLSLATFEGSLTEFLPFREINKHINK